MSLDDLRNFNSRNLWDKIINMDMEDFEKWLKDMNLLHTSRSCPECNGDMSYHYIQDRAYPNWRCTTKNCRKELGYFTGTFFEGSHLSTKEIFQISYYWCRKTHKIREIQFDMRRDDGSTVNEHALVDWNNFYRDLTCEYYSGVPIVIGMNGTNVSIDETCITKRKYHRGRLIAKQQWFFGGVEWESGRLFLEPVEHRNAATLLPIIQQHVAPFANIYSDLWAAYGGIGNLPEGYHHYTVNHSKNFIDPETGAHTQHIESVWQKFKARHKKHHGTARTLLSSYAAEFVWINEFGDDDVMYHLWSQIASKYICN